MDEAALTFDADVRPQNYAEFVAAAQKRLSRAMPGWLNVVVFMVPTGLLSVAFLKWADAVSVPRVRGALISAEEVVVLALMTGIIFAVLATWMLARWQLREFANASLREGGSYLGVRCFTLNEEGFAVEGAHGHSLTRWSVVTGMTETAGTYLLWTDPGAAVMVPKEAFADDRSRSAFVAFVTGSIAGATGDAAAGA